MNVLITGGSGYLGNAIVDKLLCEYGSGKIIVFSRGEARQAEMAERLTPLDRSKRLRFFIGDVRDRDRLRRAMNGVDTVIHAAALKRIEVGHANPVEMVKTNVDGAVNVIEASQDAGVKKAILVSTDKAWNPVSAYGFSKAMAESLFLAANNTVGKDGPGFGVCRYGNVWCSTGSVVPRWRTIMATGTNRVPVTDPDCTRFFMTARQAVDLIFRTQAGELNIPELPAYRLGDLAEAMGAKMDVFGLPKHEKKHEGMADGNTSDVARRMTIDELKEALNATGF